MSKIRSRLYSLIFFPTFFPSSHVVDTRDVMCVAMSSADVIVKVDSKLFAKIDFALP